MKVRTSELEGVVLDWAVAKAQRAAISTYGVRIIALDRFGVPFHFRPSTDWSQGGPLIEDNAITFMLGAERRDDQYFAIVGKKGEDGPTHLIAACRAIVAAKLGDEVEIPDELLGSQPGGNS